MSSRQLKPLAATVLTVSTCTRLTKPRYLSTLSSVGFLFVLTVISCFSASALTVQFTVWTDKPVYNVGETVVIRVSPTPAVGVSFWLVVQRPDGSQARLNLSPGQATSTILAGPVTGMYMIELWGQVVTWPPPSPQCMAGCQFEVVRTTATATSTWYITRTITLTSVETSWTTATLPTAITYVFTQTVRTVWTVTAPTETITSHFTGIVTVTYYSPTITRTVTASGVAGAFLGILSIFFFGALLAVRKGPHFGSGRLRPCIAKLQYTIISIRSKAQKLLVSDHFLVISLAILLIGMLFTGLSTVLSLFAFSYSVLVLLLRKDLRRTVRRGLLLFSTALLVFLAVPPHVYGQIITITVTSTISQYMTITRTVTQTHYLSSTYTTYSTMTVTERYGITVTPRTTTWIGATSTTTVYVPTTTTVTTLTGKRDLGKYAEYRTKVYEALHNAWKDPIRGALLEPIIDDLYADIVKSAILEFLPSTDAPLLKNPQELLDNIDTLHQSYELIAGKPASEEQFKHDIEVDYGRLGVALLTAEGVNIGQMPMQWDNVFWLMREKCYKERVYRVGPWVWIWIWEMSEYVNNMFSGGKLLGDLISSEKAFIPVLQKILNFMIEARSRASTNFYKTLIDLTIDFLQADIAYLDSL